MRPSPRALALLLVPTAIALALDLVLRGRLLFGGSAGELARYAASCLVSAGLWAGPLWLASRLFLAGAGRARIAARAGLFVVLGGWVLPFAAFAYGGQALHYRIFHAYMARDTVRFGIAQRGTVAAWLEQWAGAWSFVAIAVLALLTTLAFAEIARHAAPALAKASPAIPALAVAASLVALSADALETRGLQLAAPDVCFAHGVVHAVREGVANKGIAHQGISLRTPAALPALARSEQRPNVLFVITESVRADAMCSEPPPACVARFLDEVARDRIALGKLTTQSPGTVSACVLLWTGLSPNADFATMHAAPTIWEIARAVGYRTAYISAQNLKDEDFGVYVERAGIDVRASGTELGAVQSEWVGAPDERATARTLAFVREVPEGTPWLAVMHFSNTHSPYRTDPTLEPNNPHTMLPLGGYAALHNHYKNSVLLQERTFAAFLRELRALPSFEDTVVVFVSDHGEQFGEHGGLYHLHTLFEEEVRIPGFIVAGARALRDDQRAGLASFAGRRTYTEDVSATLLDLVGVWDARASLPFAARRTGRSLLHTRPDEEPLAVLSTSSAVFEADAPCRGVMQGDRFVVQTNGGRRDCYDLARDPREREPLPAAACGPLGPALDASFR